MYFSFVVRSPEEIPLKEYGLLIGEGLDTFTVTLSDLAPFRQILREHGVQIIEEHRLDAHSPVSPMDSLLLGDVPPELLS